MGFHLRDYVPYPTRAEARRSGMSRSALAQANRRSALARHLRRESMNRAEYQRATQELARAQRAAR